MFLGQSTALCGKNLAAANTDRLQSESRCLACLLEGLADGMHGAKHIVSSV